MPDPATPVMHEQSTPIPDSFMALFVPVGRQRASASLAAIAQRYELCEDMAQMLTEPARERLFELGLAEEDVLERMHAGLAGGDALDAAEALWVVRRLAELLQWPLPAALEWRGAAGEPG
jgi:hypothetical protein